MRKASPKKLIVFDLDETIGHFEEFGRFIDGLAAFLTMSLLAPDRRPDSELKDQVSFLLKFATGSEFTATISTSDNDKPLSLRQNFIDSVGKPAQCFIRVKRSSSAADLSAPSTITQAEESP